MTPGLREVYGRVEVFRFEFNVRVVLLNYSCAALTRYIYIYRYYKTCGPKMLENRRLKHRYHTPSLLPSSSVKRIQLGYPAFSRNFLFSGLLLPTVQPTGSVTRGFILARKFFLCASCLFLFFFSLSYSFVIKIRITDRISCNRFFFRFGAFRNTGELQRENIIKRTQASWNNTNPIVCTHNAANNQKLEKTFINIIVK